METMLETIPFTCSEINRLPMSIDLYEAYGEYNYGIYNETKSLK